MFFSLNARARNGVCTATDLSLALHEMQKRAINPGAPAASYGEFYTFLVNQSKTHDLATPFKRSQRHANQTRFDTFEDGSNDHDNGEDSVLNEVIAHMSVQDQPMSEEVVSALQVFSTFQ